MLIVYRVLRSGVSNSGCFGHRLVGVLTVFLRVGVAKVCGVNRVCVHSTGSAKGGFAGPPRASAWRACRGCCVWWRREGVGEPWVPQDRATVGSRHGNRFVVAMMQHGLKSSINWNEIAKAVGTRTTVQCRTHAQKVWNNKALEVGQLGEALLLLHGNKPKSIQTADYKAATLLTHLANQEVSLSGSANPQNGTSSPVELNKRKAVSPQGNSSTPKKRACRRANTDAVVFATNKVDSENEVASEPGVCNRRRSQTFHPCTHGSQLAKNTTYFALFHGSKRLLDEQGEWIQLWHEMYADEAVNLNVFQQMVGNTPEMHDPASTYGANGVYPTATLDPAMHEDPELSTSNITSGVANPYLRTDALLKPYTPYQTIDNRSSHYWRYKGALRDR